jgi:hypothetical protein
MGAAFKSAVVIASSSPYVDVSARPSLSLSCWLALARLYLLAICSYAPCFPQDFGVFIVCALALRQNDEMKC